MRIRVTEVDSAPEDLYSQVPFEVDLIREIPGPDRPDYSIGKLVAPLKWSVDGVVTVITHVIVTARWVGGSLHVGMKRTPLNIAYVVDLSVLQDAQLNFAICVYVAIGVADG
jgi:hypothetical protein